MGSRPTQFGGRDPKLGNPCEHLWVSSDCENWNETSSAAFGVVTPQLGSWPKVRETPWKSLETHYGAVFFIKLKKEEGGWRKVSAVNVDVQSGDRSSGRWSIGVRPSVSVWWMKLDAARRRQIASGANASEGELDSTPWNAGNLT